MTAGAGPGGGGRRADLHAHTTASDGVYAPEVLIGRCADAGLWAVAVTDHDTLAALPAALAAGSALGVEVWPGVELSCLEVSPSGERYDVHLLGLFLGGVRAEALAGLDEHLAARRHQRLSRVHEMVRRLNSSGVAIDWGEVEAEAAGGSVGRPHVARVLVRHGLAADLDDAFDRYLSPGRAAHVEQEPLAVSTAIDWIREGGGSAVWAHPALSGLDPEAAPWAADLDGLEADHPKQGPEVRSRLRRLCAAWGVVATGGSDCHGTAGREAVGVCTTSEADVAALAARGQARRSV